LCIYIYIIYMTQTNKLLNIFLQTPKKLNYFEIEKIMLNSWFTFRKWKWSHRKIISEKTWLHATAPIHNWDCKDVYKDKLLKFYLDNK
jgi:hypothetical protein